MKETVPQIKFSNKRKESQFDFICLEELYARKELTHTLFDFQQIDFYMLLFFTDGQGIHTIDFTDYTYHKGTILSIRKDQIHKFFKSSAKGYLLLFTEDFLFQFFNHSEVLKSLQLFNELITSPKIELDKNAYATFIKIIDEIGHEYFDIQDEYSLGTIRSLMHILFSKILRIKSKDNQILEGKKYLAEFTHFQVLVEQQCLKTKKVADYADQMAVSTKTLNNITQRIVHKPAKTFIDEIVMTQIKRLLINTKLTVKEIAYESGFQEPTNLYKFFKKHTDVSPEVFRQTYQIG
ncbi:helix-turn-helix domain-containing protein [Limibacter armeniacum]|uniref:helix-turn-helix domain-containing protein n=1 Tax=Limibacter armeniacum TaxID=466084 RepID=UPI002FE6AFEE